MNPIAAVTAMTSREPVLTISLVQAFLAMLAGFGLDLTPEQMALVLTFTSTLLAFLTRTQVTPMSTLPDEVAADVMASANAGVKKIKQSK